MQIGSSRSSIKPFCSCTPLHVPHRVPKAACTGAPVLCLAGADMTLTVSSSAKGWFCLGFLTFRDGHDKELRLLHGAASFLELRHQATCFDGSVSNQDGVVAGMPRHANRPLK